MSGATALSTATNGGTVELDLQCARCGSPDVGSVTRMARAKLLAVDASEGELAQTIADYLQAREGAGQLIFETGRTRR